MFRKGATHKLKPSPSDITTNGLSNSTISPQDHRVTTDQEGSERTQRKIEETVQYWVAQEKKAVMNYHCALELNNTVSNKRVQQLYSQDQPQEVIDQAERQASSVR